MCYRCRRNDCFTRDNCAVGNDLTPWFEKRDAPMALSKFRSLVGDPNLFIEVDGKVRMRNHECEEFDANGPCYFGRLPEGISHGKAFEMMVDEQTRVIIARIAGSVKFP